MICDERDVSEAVDVVQALNDLVGTLDKVCSHGILIYAPESL